MQAEKEGWGHMGFLKSIKQAFRPGGKSGADIKPRENSNPETVMHHDNNFLPDSAGLYPSEILLLFYVKKYKVWPKYFSGKPIPKFWEYKYGVHDILGMMKSLESRGFIENGSLTDSGENEILRNPYVLYIHQNEWVGISMRKMNAIMTKNENMKYRDVIWGEMNQSSLEYIQKHEYGLYRNTRFSMSRFLKEEGKFLPALSMLCEVIYFDLNMDLEPLIAPGVINELRLLSGSIGISNDDLSSFISDAVKKLSIPARNYPTEKIVEFIVMAAHSDTPASELRFEYSK